MRLNSKLLLIRGSQTVSGVLEKEGEGGLDFLPFIKKYTMDMMDMWFWKRRYRFIFGRLNFHDDSMVVQGF